MMGKKPKAGYFGLYDNTSSPATYYPGEPYRLITTHGSPSNSSHFTTHSFSPCFVFHPSVFLSLVSIRSAFVLCHALLPILWPVRTSHVGCSRHLHCCVCSHWFLPHMLATKYVTPASQGPSDIAMYLLLPTFHFSCPRLSHLTSLPFIGKPSWRICEKTPCHLDTLNEFRDQVVCQLLPCAAGVGESPSMK